MVKVVEAGGCNGTVERYFQCSPPSAEVTVTRLVAGTFTVLFGVARQPGGGGAAVGTSNRPMRSMRSSPS
jgi:hypothetical protein